MGDTNGDITRDTVEILIQAGLMRYIHSYVVLKFKFCAIRPLFSQVLSHCRA